MYSLILYCPLKLKYTCMFSVSNNSRFGHVFTIQWARTYVYVHVHNVMSVDARALCKYIFRWLPRSKCFSVKHALCAPYAHFGMQSVQMELWTTTPLSHFNIDRYQVCAHECTFKSPTFNRVTSIKSFDFSTLYTTIPHQKLKDRLTSIIRNAFIFKNGNRRYKYLVLGHEETYFVKEHSDSKSKYSEDDIIKMLEFLVGNIFVVFAGKVFQQTVGIPMGTNCVPLLADIFLYSYEADFIQSLLSTGKKHLASRFNLTYRYIDDVLSINNPEFENYLGQMYPAELEIKDTTESTTSAAYLDLLLSIERDGQLHTSIYDKRDDFNFHITNFPFLSSNIPSSPAYGVFISQLIRYARACSSYECFILRARRLSSKLLKQGYLVERLKSSFRKFYGRYGDLVEQYGVTLSRMLKDILILDQQWPPYQFRLSTNFMTFIPSLTFTELWVVSMEHLQRVWLASRERLPFRTPGSVPHFGTC